MIAVRNLTGILFVAVTGSLLAQPSLDSLQKKLASADNYSVKFQILIQLSKESEFYDYAKSREFVEEAAATARQLNSDWINCELYFRLAFLEDVEGDYSEGLIYDLQCVDLSTKTKDSTQLARALNNVGNHYRDMGQYHDAYYYLTQSYLIAKKHKGGRKHQDSLFMAVALHNIGTVFSELGQYDIALNHFLASSKLSAALHDEEGPAYTFDELGEFYRRKNDLEQSEKYLLDALHEARKRKIRVQVHQIQLHLANLYRDKKDYARSLRYYDSVTWQQTKINNRYGLAQCDLGKGEVMARSNNFSEAEKLYSKALNTAHELNAKVLALSCYKELSRLYESGNDYKKSLYYLQRHDALRDSIFSERALEKLFQNQVRFETENKDSQIMALNLAQQQQSSEIKRQELLRNILFVAVTLTAIMLFTVYRSGRRRKRINSLLLEHQEEIKKRSVELEQLNQVKDKFVSIISHDLRSPMNALAGTLDLLEQKYISQEEFTELSKSLRIQFDHTRTLINNLLNWTLLQMDNLKIQPEKTSIHKMVEESFAALRNLYPKNLRLENNVDEKITALADPNILNLVLRNLILNAIKFTQNGGRVEVYATETNQEITVSVSDNGIGINPEVKGKLFNKTSTFTTRGTSNEKGTGIGLILCKEFLEKNGGKIWLESEEGKGSTFFFTIPKG